MSHGPALRAPALNSKSQSIQPQVVLAVLILFAASVLALFAKSSGVVFAAGAALSLNVLLFRRAGESAILLIPLLMQWVEVCLKSISSVFEGRTLDEMSDFGVPLEQTVLFAIGALAALAVGMRLGMGYGSIAYSAEAEARRWSNKKILQISVLLILTGHFLDGIQGLFGGARQIILALASAKWAGLYLLTYWSVLNRRGYGWLAIVMASEILLGMTGFFAEFRLAFFVSLAAVISARTQLRISSMLIASFLVFVMLFTAVFWSSFKQDYRRYLNQETGAQVVLQPVKDRISYISTKAAEFGYEEFTYGFEQLVSRVSYVDYLAATIANVPAAVPHENGARLGSAMWHVLTPRILFPDKPQTALDTDVTAHYTGLSFDETPDHTSISIGWLGELYIDFGFLGSVGVTFLLGLMYGRAYKFSRDFGRSKLLNLACCAMVALPLATFGTALIKLVGSVIICFVAAWALQRFVVGPLLASAVPRITIGPVARQLSVKQPGFRD